mgnify:CR=1 FL=1
MSELQIGKKKIGNGYPVYIIAEGCDNHMGDVEVAKEMCRQAKLAGADCIKFQHHLPDEEMLSDAVIAGKNNIPLYEFLKQHALTLKQHRELMEYCKKTVKITRDEDWCMEADMPKKWVKIKPPRKLTEEQYAELVRRGKELAERQRQAKNLVKE